MNNKKIPLSKIYMAYNPTKNKLPIIYLGFFTNHNKKFRFISDIKQAFDIKDIEFANIEMGDEPIGRNFNKSIYSYDTYVSSKLYDFATCDIFYGTEDILSWKCKKIFGKYLTKKDFSLEEWLKLDKSFTSQQIKDMKKRKINIEEQTK